MKVVLCGQWQTCAGAALIAAPAQGCDSPSDREALEAVARGIVQTLPDARVECLPFGPGEAFVEACEQAGGPEAAFTVPFDCEDGHSLGAAVRDLAGRGRRSVIEAGHVASVDLWLSFLAGLAGLSPTEGEAELSLPRLREGVGGLVKRCRQELGEYAPILAATTLRPFTGMASMLAVNPDLTSREDLDVAIVGEWVAALDAADARARTSVPLAAGAPPRVSTLPGGGAGGGIGAVIAAVGGQIVDAGDYLRDTAGLAQMLEDADMCVILEPYLHGPLLAESYVPTLTGACADYALPTLAVGVDSSLSRHEVAQWGLHGVMLGADSVDACENLGVRVAHTWLRRMKRSI